jgi:hypothetical protein
MWQGTLLRSRPSAKAIVKQTQYRNARQENHHCLKSSGLSEYISCMLPSGSAKKAVFLPHGIISGSLMGAAPFATMSL